nr:hypothetical protein [uncultured Albidiferax sp.]
MATVEPTGPGLTFAVSEVRLAGFARRMSGTMTLKALVAIKEEAKPKLLPRDLPKLQLVYEARQTYLRSIRTDPTTTEGTP